MKNLNEKKFIEYLKYILTQSYIKFLKQNDFDVNKLFNNLVYFFEDRTNKITTVNNIRPITIDMEITANRKFIAPKNPIITKKKKLGVANFFNFGYATADILKESNKKYNNNLKIKRLQEHVEKNQNLYNFLKQFKNTPLKYIEERNILIILGNINYLNNTKNEIIDLIKENLVEVKNSEKNNKKEKIMKLIYNTTLNSKLVHLLNILKENIINFFDTVVKIEKEKNYGILKINNKTDDFFKNINELYKKIEEFHKLEIKSIHDNYKNISMEELNKTENLLNKCINDFYQIFDKNIKKEEIIKDFNLNKEFFDSYPYFHAYSVSNKILFIENEIKMKRKEENSNNVVENITLNEDELKQAIENIINQLLKENLDLNNQINQLVSENKNLESKIKEKIKYILKNKKTKENGNKIKKIFDNLTERISKYKPAYSTYPTSPKIIPDKILNELMYDFLVTKTANEIVRNMNIYKRDAVSNRTELLELNLKINIGNDANFLNLYIGKNELNKLNNTDIEKLKNENKKLLEELFKINTKYLEDVVKNLKSSNLQNKFNQNLNN